MKNNNLQDIKPTYLQETRYASDDAISLIDITIILLNRYKLITFVLIGFLILGIAIALLIPNKYTYSTSLEIGSQIINGEVRAFESPQTLLAKLQHSFIPKALLNHKQANAADKEIYTLSASIPKSSNIIVLETKGTEKQAKLLSQLLHNVTQKSVKDHSRFYESVKLNLTSRLNVGIDELKSLKQSNNNQTEISNQQNLIELYSSQLANLRNTRELLPPMQSLEPSGASGGLIIIIAAFAGLFVGVFVAFIAELISKVKDATKKREAQP